MTIRRIQPSFLEKDFLNVVAKARGVKFGRNRSLTTEETAELQNRRQQGTLIKTLMKEYQISKATVYRYLNQIHSS